MASLACSYQKVGEGDTSPSWQQQIDWSQPSWLHMHRTAVLVFSPLCMYIHPFHVFNHFIRKLLKRDCWHMMRKPYRRLAYTCSCRCIFASSSGPLRPFRSSVVRRLQKRSKNPPRAIRLVKPLSLFRGSLRVARCPIHTHVVNNNSFSWLPEKDFLCGFLDILLGDHGNSPDAAGTGGARFWSPGWFSSHTALGYVGSKVGSLASYDEVVLNTRLLLRPWLGCASKTGDAIAIAVWFDLSSPRHIFSART